MKTHTNILICGCGIIGLTLARELVARGMNDITIIEKEVKPGAHASGRNSGVLHAGIYYHPDSFKAQLCSEGNKLLTGYCFEKGLRILRKGKVIVTRSEEEIETLDMLFKRASENGVRVKLIDEKELAEIEPAAQTREKAIFSPDTSVVDPEEIVKSLYHHCLSTKKITIELNRKLLSIKNGSTAETNKGDLSYKLFINAAGAYSDRIAHLFGRGREYRMIPFRGTYRKISKNQGFTLNGNIYPVPDMINPFLGVHFTRSAGGDIYIGPTAIPALGRENYSLFEDLGKEAVSILLMDLKLLFVNRGFRSVAMREPRKYFKKLFIRNAGRLVKSLDPAHVESTGKMGIRPQLINLNTNELVMDFLVEKGEKSIHILNSISPAFTSSMSFAKLIADEYINKIL